MCGRDNRAGLLLQIEYQEVDYHLLAEYQGGSPLQIKYKNDAAPSRSNTREVLSFRSEILGGGYLAGPNIRGGYSDAEQVPGRCYPLKLNTRIGYPFQIKYQKGRPATDQIPGRRYHLKRNTRAGLPL